MASPVRTALWLIRLTGVAMVVIALVVMAPVAVVVVLWSCLSSGAWTLG